MSDFNCNIMCEKSSPTKGKLKIQVSKNNAWSYKKSPSSRHKKKVRPNCSEPIINHLESPHLRPRKMVSFREYVEDEKKEIFTEEEKLPSRIKGTYVYDYNILYIHEILLKKFKQDKNRQINLLSDKIQLEKNKIKSRQTLIERRKSQKKIIEYESELKKWGADVDMNKYLERSKYLISSYTKLGSIKQVVSFASNSKDEQLISPEDDDVQKYRHSIIFEYLEIARRYIPIDVIREIPNKDSCPGCGIMNDELELIEDENGSTICPNCGLEKIAIARQPFYADGCRVNNSRNNYEDRANFEKVLMRFQGKQQNKPPKELYVKLDEWFMKNGLKSSEEYRKIPLNSEGKKDGTSRELMYKALGEIGCSGYYDDINLIMNVFWGWLLDDVSHLEDRIMKDYDLFQMVYEEILDKQGRKSSLNSQWRLYKHLRRLGYDCKANDFKIPSTPDILEFHKIKWGEGCKILGWEDV